MKLNETKLGVLLGYLSIVFNLLTGILLTPIVVRYLGREDYGLYQLIGAFVAYLSVLDLGFAATTTRYIARYNALKDEKGKENFLALTTLIYGIIAFLVLVFGFILYYQIENIFGDTLSVIELIRAKKMTILLVISMAVTVFGNMFIGSLDGNERFIFPRLINIIKSCLNILLGVFIVMNGASSVELTLLNVILNILIFIMLAIFAFKFANIKIKYYFFDRPLLKEVFVFSFYVFLQTMMSLLYWRIGSVALGIMIGTSSVAVFALAIQVNHIFLYSTTAISSVLLPKASKLSTTDATGEQLTDFMIIPGRYSLMIYSLMLIGFIHVGKDFIKLWVGDGYENTYYIVVMVVLAGMIPRIQNAGIQLARAYNMQKFFTSMYFFMGLLNIIGTIIFVSIWGEIGAAVGTTIALILGNTIGANFFYYKYLDINIFRYFKETFWGIHWAIVAAFFSGFLLNLFMPEIHIIYRFISKIIIITCIYLFILIKFGFRNDEKKLVKRIFPVYSQ